MYKNSCVNDKSYQLDIFGNWKSLKQVKFENKCNERYVKKELKFKKDYIKCGGVFNVNKAFIKTD